MSLFNTDDHYSELSYNRYSRGRKQHQVDPLHGTLRRVFWWKVAWLLESPFRSRGRNEWFIPKTNVDTPHISINMVE